MKTIRLISLTSTALLTCVLGGCSTKVLVQELDPIPSANGTVDGIPFMIKERYQVILYRLNGEKYDKVDSKNNDGSLTMLANRKHLYLLRMEGSPLSDGSVKVKLEADNTLTLASVESTSKGQAAIAQLAASSNDLTAAKKTRDTDAGKRVTDAETALQANEKACLDYLDALAAVRQAQIKYDGLSSTATALDVDAAAATLLKAKVAANQATRRAGQATNCTVSAGT